MSTEKRRARFLCLSIFLILIFALHPVAAFEPRLVLDYENGEEFDNTWVFRYPVEAGDRVFFTTYDRMHGREVWATDGTPEGTVFTGDLCPGICIPYDWDTPSSASLQDKLYVSSESDEIPGIWQLDGSHQRPVRIAPSRGELLPLGSRLLFTQDWDHKIWSTDGTVEGTQALGDLRYQAWARVGDQAFIKVSGGGLWRTDGTPEGTYAVTESFSFSKAPNHTSMLAMGDKVLLKSSGALWVSDGTSDGTAPIFDYDSPFSLSFIGLAGDRAVFMLSTFLGPDPELWSTDGTAEGTTFLATPPDCYLADEYRFETDDKLFIFFEPRFRSPELWATDGTSTGTRRVMILELDSSADQVPKAVTREKLFFGLTNDESDRSLWMSDGTVEGTRALPTSRTVTWIVADDDYAYYGVFDGPTSELRRTDGTPEGTVTLESMTAPEGSKRRLLGPWGIFGGRLYYTGVDELGYQPWVNDGSPGSGRRLTAVGERFGLEPEGLATNSNWLFFQGTRDGPPGTSNEPQLWLSDGTDAGTHEFTGPMVSDPHVVLRSGDDLLIAGEDQLWLTDGTDAGTQLLLDELRSPRAFISEALVLDGMYYFIDRLEDKLWRSDGTTGNTSLVLDLPEHSGALSFSGLLRVDGSSTTPRMVFLADDNLWSSDGTFAGTYTIPLPNPPLSLMSLGSQVFVELEYGRLWLTDGTEAGTQLALDPWEAFGGELMLWMAGHSHFYAAVWRSHGDGFELWQSGTDSASAKMLGRLPALPQEDFGDPHRFIPATHVAIGDAIYFTVGDGDFGVELWRADTSGTSRITDIWPGEPGSFPKFAREVDGLLYFAASDGLNGVEPWVSDGTTEGTLQIAEIAPGNMSSNPSEFTAFGDEIFFRASNPHSGTELWAITPRPPCPDANACLNSWRFQVSVRWRDQHTGGTEGTGRPVSFSDDSALFWFFDDDNIELVVKILDGRSINDHFWFFSGALSDVEYWIDVLDVTTGETRTFYNPPGNLCGISDIEALPASDAAGIPSPPPPLPPSLASWPTTTSTATKSGNCGGDENALCLRDNRFRVEVEWKNQHAGGVAGDGMPITGTDESGYFWFFDDGSVDLIVKILDGRPLNGQFWLFYGALSDVEYWVTVTDTATGAQATYHNPPGELCGVGDITAL